MDSRIYLEEATVKMLSELFRKACDTGDRQLIIDPTYQRVTPFLREIVTGRISEVALE